MFSEHSLLIKLPIHLSLSLSNSPLICTAISLYFRLSIMILILLYLYLFAYLFALISWNNKFPGFLPPPPLLSFLPLEFLLSCSPPRPSTPHFVSFGAHVQL